MYIHVLVFCFNVVLIRLPEFFWEHAAARTYTKRNRQHACKVLKHLILPR